MFNGKKVKASLSGLFDRRKRLSDQSTGKFSLCFGQNKTLTYSQVGESGGTTSSPPSLVLQADMRLATGTNQKTSVPVGNASSVALNDGNSPSSRFQLVNWRIVDTHSAAANTLHNDIPNIVESEYELEGWHDETILRNLDVAPGIYPKSTGGFFNNAHHLILNNPSMVDNSTKIVHQGEDKITKGEISILV